MVHDYPLLPIIFNNHPLYIIMYDYLSLFTIVYLHLGHSKDFKSVLISHRLEPFRYDEVPGQAIYPLVI